MKFIPTLVSYCLDKPERKDASGIMHGTKVKKRLIRCMVSPDDIEGLFKSTQGRMTDTSKAHYKLSNITEYNPKDTPEMIAKKEKMEFQQISIAPWRKVFEDISF